MEGFSRPKAVVLDESALVPDANLISPPPNQFGHELVRDEPFYFTDDQRDAGKPAGRFQSGTHVVLLRRNGGKHCWVVDGQGLFVQIELESLRKL